jgi:hydrogenase nickel incorporation protein HypA/HybF
MHELSITEEILRVATEHAKRANARRITDIHLVIGDLSSVVNDSVQFYFDYLSEGTIAEGAALHFDRIPARLRCRQCDEVFEPRGRDWDCPHCGTIGGEIIAGQEFYMDSIEVQ